MGCAIELRTDYTSEELRLLAKRGKDTAQTRRLLAIAAVLDGASRAEPAKAGGMDRQTLRDWVIRSGASNPTRRNTAPAASIVSPSMTRTVPAVDRRSERRDGERQHCAQRNTGKHAAAALGTVADHLD